MDGYIYFNEIRTKKKTKHFEITSISTDLVLGEIKWYAQWRKYAFFPHEETFFDEKCLKVIFDKIISLMKKRNILSEHK